MQRYFLNDDGSILKEDYHHILKVMRMKDKDQVELCLKASCFLAALKIKDDVISYEKIDDLSVNPPKQVTLVQGLPKGDKIDLVTKYATIFGVREIVFVPMKRSVAKLANIEHKVVRLNRIAKEAAELAKLSQIPPVSFLNQLNKVVFQNQRIVLLDEAEKLTLWDDMVNDLKNETIVLIVGPEGGIDEEERTYLKNLGAMTLSLGNTIYPTEIAFIPFLTKL